MDAPAGNLLSPEYQDQLREMHDTREWGTTGHSHTEAVQEFAEQIGAKSILDYGCGCGTLRQEMKDWSDFREYDPGLAHRSEMPEPADLVVCTDVLEHVEPECLFHVIDHLYELGTLGAYLHIATKPAIAILPDGRNAHLIVEDGFSWANRFGPMWRRVSGQHHENAITLWCRRCRK